MIRADFGVTDISKLPRDRPCVTAPAGVVMTTCESLFREREEFCFYAIRRSFGTSWRPLAPTASGLLYPYPFFRLESLHSSADLAILASERVSLRRYEAFSWRSCGRALTRASARSARSSGQ